MAQIEAVIFDFSTLLVPGNPALPALKELLAHIKARGIRIVVFSTRAMDVDAQLAQVGLPAADLALFERDVGAPKGSPDWIREAAGRLGARPHQLLYVG